MTKETYQIWQPGKIIFGPGTVSLLAEEVGQLKVNKVLLVTDPGVYQSGLINPIYVQLIQKGFSVDIYHDSEPEPTLIGLNHAADILCSGKYELIIGIGGGSSIDTAKGLSILLLHKGKARDYLGTNNVPGPGIPLIAIPTTAGTGSEVTNIAIFSDEEKELKQGIVSPYLIAKVAIGDPVLTYRCPKKVTAASGIDALVHAIECFTSVKANAYTDTLALKAMSLIADNLKKVVSDGSNEKARNNIAEGALLAGIAFCNASVAAVHALAYPLGARFHVSHGVANGLLLPYVMECNFESDPIKYCQIARVLGVNTDELSPTKGAELGVIAAKSLVTDINLPTRLRDLSIPQEALEGMAVATMDVTRLLANNPKKLSLEDVRNIWQKAW